VSPSGRWVAMLHKEGTTILWPVGQDTDPKRWSGSSEKNLRLPRHGVISIAFSPSCDEDVLLAASREGFVSTWQVGDQGLTPRVRLAHDMPVDHASFSEDGARILTLADDRIGRIWDTATGALLRTLGDPARVDWHAMRSVTPHRLAWPEPTPLPVDKPVPLAELPPGTRVALAGQTWHRPTTLTLEAQAAWRVMGDVAIPFLEPHGVTQLIDFEGSVWLLHGALFAKGPVTRVDADSVTPLAGLASHVASADVVDGALWLSTDKGALRVRGRVIERVTPEGVKAHALRVVDGHTWLLTSAGAYRLEDGLAVRICDRISVLDVKQVGTLTWILAGTSEMLSTTRGPAYRVDGYRAVAIADDYKCANFVEHARGLHWVGTDRGLYGVDDNGAVFRAEGLDENVKALQTLGEQLWVHSAQAMYRIEGRGARAFRPLDAEVSVDRLEAVAGRLWLHTTRFVRSDGVGTNQPGPLYEVCVDAVHAAPTQALPVRQLVMQGDDLWFIVDNAPAQRLRAGVLKAFPRQGVVVTAVSLVCGEVWLHGPQGAWRVQGARARRLPDKTLPVWRIEERDGHVHVLAGQEAYRIEGNEAVRVGDEDGRYAGPASG
jgi:hypothetical protein